MEATKAESSDTKSTESLAVAHAPKSCRPSPTAKRWMQWLFALAATVVGGAVTLALVRTWPESFHLIISDLPTWLRVVFTFAACIMTARGVVEFFGPRASHLRRSHPPVWLAVTVGIAVVATIDLTHGVSDNGYQAAIWEWATYGALAIAVAYFHWQLTGRAAGESEAKATSTSARVQFPQDWESLKVWLASDSPATHDYLGNLAVAERLKTALVNGVRSIGLVGPFGSGKTSIVNWIIELVAEDSSATKKLVFSKHSCWGFERSASAVQAMLADAIANVAPHIDTFAVRSLPESYRQVFSAGGEWLDKLSNLVFSQRDPLEQFRTLNDLLEGIGTRLVFVVEDLDRTGTTTFDVQEVLGFLQQLKEFPRLSFILTGGVATPPRIDFAKLCDQIENLQTLTTKQAGELVALLRTHCLSQDEFKHHVLTGGDEKQWNPSWYMTRFDQDAVLAPEALARLLNTPRALRHTLQRTHDAWKRLVGEVDWDHLVVLSALRLAAREAFDFVTSNRGRLTYPHERRGGGNVEKERSKSFLERDWQAATRGVEWNGDAARTLIDFLFPKSPMASDIGNFDDAERLQGVHEENYWRRAFDESLAANEVRDQVVMRDLAAWKELPSAESSLVAMLCEVSEYGAKWESLALEVLHNKPDEILLLFQHVLARICEADGPEASDGSQGFNAVWSVAAKRVHARPQNRRWLEDRISEAAQVSIALVKDLWDNCCARGATSLLRREDQTPVREHVISELKRRCGNSLHLSRTMSPRNHYVLYQLVYDPGNERSEGEIAEWRWLVLPLLECVRRGDVAVALSVCGLIGRESQGEEHPAIVDTKVLNEFFGESVVEIIDAIGRLSDRVNDSDRQFLNDITRLANADISKENTSNSLSGE